MNINDRIATACARAPYADTMTVGSPHVFVDHVIENGAAICHTTMTYGLAYESSAMTAADFLEDDSTCGNCRRILRRRYGIPKETQP